MLTSQILFALVFLLPQGSNVDPGLVDLLEKVDVKNAEVQTLRAHFVQRKEISLLKDPVEQQGTFLLKKTQGMRFDFDGPEQLQLFITPNEMISLTHSTQRASRIPNKSKKGNFTDILISKKLDTVLTYFDIIRAVRKDGSGPQRLILKPKTRKLKKKLKEAIIWVNEENLIDHIKVTLTDGDMFELILSNIEINFTLDDEAFNVQIPESYEVDDRFSSLFGSEMGL